MKTAIAFVLALCVSSAFAGRNLQQNLPTLGSSGNAPAPAPGPSNGCALALLQSNPDYSLLLTAIQASSEASLLQSLLSSPTELATLFVPTNNGISATLSKLNISPANLLSNPDMLTSIIQYHITPSQLSVADLKDGYSFNTLYEVNNVAQSIAIQGNGLSATVVGSASSAPITGSTSVCGFQIYPINGLLLSNKGSAAAAPTSTTG